MPEFSAAPKNEWTQGVSLDAPPQNEFGQGESLDAPPTESMQPPAKPVTKVTKKPKDNKQGDDKEQDDKQEEDHADGRNKQKEYFKEELRRLHESLEREASKIHRPPVEKYKPYIFNTLEPYYNVHTAKYLIELPDEERHGYVSRKTAVGLCDPWTNLAMDNDLEPKVDSKAVPKEPEHTEHIHECKKNKSQKRPEKKGSTRLPKFPVVTLENAELATRKMDYSDVPMLREELRGKYSSSAQDKVDSDYTRTKQDFYRMELDKLEEIHPVNRDNMKGAYLAYLQNTPGSKKAIRECVKSIKAESG